MTSSVWNVMALGGKVGIGFFGGNVVQSTVVEPPVEVVQPDLPIYTFKKPVVEQVEQVELEPFNVIVNINAIERKYDIWVRLNKFSIKQRVMVKIDNVKIKESYRVVMLRLSILKKTIRPVISHNVKKVMSVNNISTLFGYNEVSIDNSVNYKEVRNVSS